MARNVTRCAAVWFPIKQEIVAIGKPPIEGEATMDPVVRDFIDQCLQLDPGMRPVAGKLLGHHFLRRPRSRKRP